MNTGLEGDGTDCCQMQMLGERQLAEGTVYEVVMILFLQLKN